jgi:hypothetical protein
LVLENLLLAKGLKKKENFGQKGKMGLKQKLHQVTTLLVLKSTTACDQMYAKKNGKNEKPHFSALFYNRQP